LVESVEVVHRPTTLQRKRPAFFTLLSVDNPDTIMTAGEPIGFAADPRTSVQLSPLLSVVSVVQQRMVVMSNDSIVVGSKASSRKPLPPIAESNGAVKPANGTPRKRPATIAGAMSQQRGHSGNESAPQKLVHLVGCRDLNAARPVKR
jgi:hypothetical protein